MDVSEDYNANGGSNFEESQAEEQEFQTSEAAVIAQTESTEEICSEQPQEEDGEEDSRKIFVGGLNMETDNGALQTYFSQFGEVLSATIKTDFTTGRPRGFGFVLFKFKAGLAKALAYSSPHMICGKKVDPKPAKAKDDGKSKEPVLKVFVGGVSPDSSQEALQEYFSQFGTVAKLELPTVRGTEERRGFIFVTYETEEMVDKCCETTRHTIGQKECDVKKATPKQEHMKQSGRGGFGMGLRGGRGGGGRGGFRGYGGGYGGGYDAYSSGTYGSGGGYGGGGGYEYSQGGYGGGGGYEYSQGQYGGGAYGGGAYGGGGGYGGAGSGGYWQGGDYGKMKARRGGGAGYAPY